MKTNWKRAAIFGAITAAAASIYIVSYALMAGFHSSLTPKLWVYLFLFVIPPSAFLGLGIHFLTEHMFSKDTEKRTVKT